jgi:hypothetical protein
MKRGLRRVRHDRVVRVVARVVVDVNGRFQIVGPQRRKHRVGATAHAGRRGAQPPHAVEVLLAIEVAMGVPAGLIGGTDIADEHPQVKGIARALPQHFQDRAEAGILVAVKQRR